MMIRRCGLRGVSTKFGQCHGQHSDGVSTSRSRQIAASRFRDNPHDRRRNCRVPAENSRVS